jgi:hypothetical protein
MIKSRTLRNTSVLVIQAIESNSSALNQIQDLTEDSFALYGLCSDQLALIVLSNNINNKLDLIQKSLRLTQQSLVDSIKG